MAERGDLVSVFGKRVEEMTREELVAAVKALGRAYANAVENHQATMDFYRFCDERRRG